jgi:hypothetical protein
VGHMLVEVEQQAIAYDDNTIATNLSTPVDFQHMINKHMSCIEFKSYIVCPRAKSDE